MTFMRPRNATLLAVLLVGTCSAQTAPLSITTPSLPAGTVNVAYTTTLLATGGSTPYTWSATGLPAGLSITPTTGVVSGTPAIAGSFSLQIQVTDANNLVATQAFTLTINPVPLSITTVPPLFNGITGTPYSQTFSASGGVPPYTWSMTPPNSVPGLTFTTSSNQGLLSGSPTATGTYSFTIQVNDAAGGRASMSFSVTVNPPALTIVTGTSLPVGTVGVSYSQQFSVVGGTPPYVWSLTAGSVPGLSLNPSQATLSGTPTSAGTFSFTLQVNDAANLTASRAFTVTINPALLTITTSTQLPDGVLGSSYSYQLQATGGVPPYTWSASGLPAGLAIDPNAGTISGTLAAAGTISFAVRVVDSERNSATNQLRINVSLPPVSAISVSGLPATALPGPAGGQYPLQITLASAYPAPLSGQAILSFTPDVGSGDGTIQFSTGGTTANFTIPAGSTNATFLDQTGNPAAVLVQTGTVAGTVTVSLSNLNAGGLDVTPAPAPAVAAHIDQAAPVIQSATLTRSGTGLTIQITGYSTAREVTQAVFTFSAASGQTLQSTASQITIAVDTLFSNFFQNPNTVPTGSQFVFSQPFSVQGDATAVIPQTVALTNRKGTVTANITQ